MKSGSKIINNERFVRLLNSLPLLCIVIALSVILSDIRNAAYMTLGLNQTQKTATEQTLKELVIKNTRMIWRVRVHRSSCAITLAPDLHPDHKQSFIRSFLELQAKQSSPLLQPLQPFNYKSSWPVQNILRTICQHI